MSALKNAKHEAVLQAFLADPKRIGWRAYQAVYSKSSQRAAETAWSRLLKLAEFAARLETLKIKVATEVAAEVKVSAQRVFDELALLAFANSKDYFDDEDRFVGMKNLTRDQAAAIASLEIEPQVIKVGTGKGAKSRIVHKVKFKLRDKRDPLVDLGKHFGMFTPKPEKPADGDGKDDRPMTDLEAARRVAFVLERGARAKPAKQKAS